ncbi:MAG TPA: efflux RND transporter permease subunit, partial [Acidobacteriota bacterium]|nr:efflux RND transporter permease subunit [Acidobacteriota bacterium]
LRTMGRIEKVEDFNRIILAYRNGATVTFSDVGRVIDTVEEPRTLARLNGRSAVALQIRKQSGTNTVAVVDRILARLEEIKPTLPPDIQIQTIRDQSRFIRQSVNDIQHHLILGGLLASLVVFLFVRNLRSTIIAAIAIPTSIIGTFTLMKAFDFTLNNMTLLALSLATGIVIDDAIVVLENIFRYIEEKGVAPKKAAALATNEIGLAVMATTLSLVVIFLPVAFMTGQVGRYFYSFGIASAAAIMISMFVAFTLTPALCSVWLKPIKSGEGEGHKTSKSRGFYARMDRAYGHMLGWSLRHRAIMLLIAGTVSVSAILLFPRLGKELVPDDDQSEFGVNVRMPQGTSFARADEYAREVETVLKQLPELRNIFTTIDGVRIEIYLGLAPLEERSISQQDLMRQARAMLSRFSGARISVTGGTDISGASNTGGRGSTNRLYLLLQGREIDQLRSYMDQLLERVRTIPGIVDADTSYEATQPELRINIDRARAADLGVTIDSLASSMRLLVGGEEVSRYKEGDEQYVVRLRLDEPFRNNPAAMGQLLIPSSTQGSVRVSDVSELRFEPGPASIDRYNRQRQVTLYANLDKLPLGDAITAAKAEVDKLDLAPGYQAIFGASARTFSEASNDFVIAILLAVAFIYMVLASQFNSFIHPLTIMTALPLSLPAGLLTLLVFDRTLNVYSAIGLMMLFGIVKKNSILQVDYTNTLRAQGMERHEAIIAANHVRLRPILMTTISIIAGMIPIALGRGAGAGSRSSMALCIIGGQILCLLLTLLITPVVYSYFDDLREWKPSRLFQRLRGKPVEPAVSQPTPETSR